MTISAISSINLADLGPLRVSEPWLGRRLRVHQAWYRAAVLNLPDYGVTRPPHERPLGSILSPAAVAARLNFLSDEAHALFETRHAAGWGIDPVRTRAYMTSSQALTLNILGPLISRPAWFIASLNAVRLDAPVIKSIDAARIEYAIGLAPDGLGDRTTADAVLDVTTVAGPSMIVIETKLGDRFNSRSIKLGDGYAAAAHLWRRGVVDADSASNQLARVHALGTWLAARCSHTENAIAELLLLRHSIDSKAEAIARDYRQELRDPNLFHEVPLQTLFSAMARTADSSNERDLAIALDLRYSSLASSERVWQEFLGTFPRAGGSRLARHDNG